MAKVDVTVRALTEQLFGEPGMNAFVVLDGAAIPDLREMLWQHEVEHYCLYRGELEPDMASVAPYVVRLERGTPFTDWVLSRGWGRNWGVFALAAGSLRDMRQHFRAFIIVYGPGREPLYFRFYDPRVLRDFLPTCTPEERAQLFGPVAWYALEDADDGTMLKFRLGERGLETHKAKIAARTG